MAEQENAGTIALPVDIAGIFDAEVMAQVTVLIVGGIFDGESLSLGTDNGDGTYTLLEPDLKALADLRLILPASANGGIRELAITAISGDGRVETGHLSADPSMAVVEAGFHAFLDEPAVGGETGEIGVPLRITLDADAAAAVSEVSFTLAGLPENASLSAGSEAGDGAWRFTRGDLDGLTLILDGLVQPCNLDLAAEVAGVAGGRLAIRRTLALRLPGPLVTALGGLRQPSPEERAAWMTGTGVFTFFGGEGGDVFAGGYGWTAAAEAGESGAAPGAGDSPLTARRSGGAGLWLGGIEPVKW